MSTAPEPRFFATPAAFRRWLEKNHDRVSELWVGYYKKASGRPSITYPESVEEALCFGWIDGVRKTIDAESYMNRFTPRRPGSIWSHVNVERVEKLIREGRMAEPGLAVWRQRDESKTYRYSFEQGRAELPAAFEREFKRNRKAWSFFQSQPPSYRRTATWWVISAKREETRQKRLATLIADSAAGRRIGLLERPAKTAKKAAKPKRAARRGPSKN